MNTLLKFRHTPTGRTKMARSENVRVSTGASTRDSQGKWTFISVHVNTDEVGDASYWVQMDRETAARVARQITEYLAADVPS